MYLLTLLSPMSMPSLSSSPWMRGAPQPGFSRHILRIRSRISRENDRSSELAMPHLPCPEQAKAGTMPGEDRFGLDDGQRRAPVTPDARQPDPQQSIPGCQFRALPRRPLKHADLVAQSQVLQLESSARTEDRGQSGEEYRERNEH